MIYGLWKNPLYAQTAGLVMAFLILLSIPVYILKSKKGAPYATAWASLKSWLFVAPLLFAAFALPRPLPALFVTIIAVLSAKSFFQMVGMYHRSWFVSMTYIGIFIMGHLAWHGQTKFYDMAPMIFLALISLIPILRNSSTHMIQYIALSLLAFIFWGWSYMHMARLLTFKGGELMVIYLYMLTEVSENTCWACSKLFGHYRPFSRISTKVTVEGMVVALIVTMLAAWGMRHLLPDRSERFWIAAGLVAAVFGRMGDLLINVIRRDLGIKDTGVFIIGRDGVLTRADKLIFVGPMYFYLFLFLQQHISL